MIEHAWKGKYISLKCHGYMEASHELTTYISKFSCPWNLTFDVCKVPDLCTIYNKIYYNPSIKKASQNIKANFYMLSYP